MPPVMPSIQTLLPPSQDAAPKIGLTRRATTFSVASPTEEEPRVDDYLVQDDDYEKHNEELGMIWNSIMEQGDYSTGHSYTKIEVLMLSHDEEQDDLKLEPEMEALKKVFENSFNFGVTVEKIKKHHQRMKRSQAQVNAIVANWAYKHDGPRTLLIVYFAGHGTPSDKNELELYGRKEPMSEIGGDGFNKVVWDNTERNLHYLIADVLQIFDCCFAGATSAQECSEEDQTIEFLAACLDDETTPRPGKTSFTSALIWALEGFAKKGSRFGVNNLLREIKQAPDFRRNRQHPTLTRRARKPRQQRIILHALEPEGARAAAAKKEKQRARSEVGTKQYALDLKFVFDEWPSDDHIRALGEDLNTSVRARELPMCYIQWRGLAPREAHARQFIELLQERVLQDWSPLGKRDRDASTEDANSANWKKVVTGIKRIGTSIENIDESLHKVAEEYHHTHQANPAPDDGHGHGHGQGTGSD